MKTMGRLIALILLFTLNVQAGYDLEYNLATFHYFETCQVADRFANKFADCGKAIRNPLIALKDRDTQIRYLMGYNSVGTLMAGVTITAPYPSIVIGAYLQDVSEFKRRGVSTDFPIDNGSIGLVPIIGYEESIRFKDYKLFTIITPILATVGIGYRF